MSRKLMKSSAKPPLKSQAMTLKLEKDFLNAPTQLTAQLTKEIATLKQAEGKLKSAMAKAKMQAQKSMSNAKVKASANLLKDLTKQLNENSKSLDMFTNKHQKMTALRKILNQFNKDWSKKSKESKAKKTAAVSSKKSATKPAQTASIISLEQPQVETFESTRDNVQAIGSE